MSKEPQQKNERRDFLATAAWWTTAGTIGFATVGALRMPMPGVLPGSASDVKIGPPGDYPVSEEPIPVSGHNLYVLHDNEGYAVLGSVCTHLGCVVTVSSEGFECPCHGSRFRQDGKVVQGPAPSPMPWFELALSADGQIVVRTRKTVPVGTKFRFT